VSKHFVGMNGVKQSAVLSPILFCVYFDSLLTKLTNAGYGCHIGHMFSGVLAYADDDVLLAPSGAMRNMLLLCDDFANEFSVKFNASKSKCIVVQPRSSHLSTVILGFNIDGNRIEIVDQWLHLAYDYK